MDRFPRIRILIPWYGPLPYWWQFYLTTCKANKDVHWLFVSDAMPEGWDAPNLDFLQLPLQELWKLAADQLQVGLDWRNHTAYKICDLRLAFGNVFEEHLAGFEWFGWGDIDVIYGNLRDHLGRLLQNTRCDVVSFFPNKISGFLTLVRNSENSRRLHEARNVFFPALMEQAHRGTDEVPLREGLGGYSIHAENFFAHPYGADVGWIDGSRNWPEVWMWRPGRNGPSLTTNRTGVREFVALHFMNWKGGPWARKNNQAQWERRITEGLPVVHCDASKAAQGFNVTPTGFHR